MKAIFILMCMFFLMFKLSAQVISYDEARQKAQKFFFATDKSSQSLKSASVVKVDTFATYYTKIDNKLKSAGQKEEPAFYIFNRTDKPGFVIVSGDKRVKEIIAYSNSNVFIDPNLGLQALLNQYVEEISYAIENNLPEINEVYDFTQYESGTWLLGDIEWGQSPAPFNSKTPNNYSAGCVATVLAQIIYYYEYPKIGIGDLQNSEYIYDLMVGKPAEGPNEQISNLLRDCGVATKTVYGPKGSSSDINNAKAALESSFNYKNCLFKDKTISINWSEWEDLIIDEINSRRPVYYRASDLNMPWNDPSGSHAFIIDGYESDKFHINWGWKGTGNDFYSLTSLKPVDGEIKYNFSYQHQMLIGIAPKLPDLKPVNQSLSSSTVQAGSDLTVKCAEDNSGSISAGANVIYIYLSENGVLTPEENGDRKIGEINVTSNVAANSSSDVYQQTITIPANVPPKSYKLFFWVDGGKKVTEIWEDNNFVIVPITVTAAPTPNTPTLIVPTFSLPFGDVTVNQTSTKNFSISGSDLTGNVSVSVSGTGFTISKNETSGFSTSLLSFSPSVGTLASQKVYVRFSPTSAGSKPGSISITSSGASSKTVSLSGAGVIVATPSITTSEPLLSFGNVTVNTNSTQSFTISGSNLTGSVAVAVCCTDYKISKSQSSGFTGELSFSPSGGTLTSQTVYVRFSPASTGSKSGAIAIVSSGAGDKLVNLSGTGVSGGSGLLGDNSCSPQSLTIRTSCNYESFTTINATPPSPDIPFTGTSLPYKKERYDDDVWFSITPSSSSEVTIKVRPTSNKNNFDVSVGLYQGSCSSPTQIQIGQGVAGNEGDPESIIFAPQAKTTYLIRVFSYGEGSIYSGDFDICVTSEDGEEEEEHDFYIDNEHINLSTVAAGEQIIANCEQCYVGNGSGLKSYVGYFLSSDKYFDENEDILLENDNSTLDDGECQGEEEPLTIPENTEPDTYYILFVTDYDNRFPDEIDEENNVEWERITVLSVQIPEIFVSESSFDFGETELNWTGYIGFSVSGENLSGDISLFVSDGFTIQEQLTKAESNPIILSPSGGVVSKTNFWVKFNPTSLGKKLGTLTISSIGATNLTIPITGTGIAGSTPAITVSNPSLSFGNIEVNTNSTSQSFTVSGNNLTADISLTAPAGFEISKSSGSGYANSQSLKQSGGSVSNTTIYVRFSPTSTGAKSGDISISSSGADTKKVAVSGTGTQSCTPPGNVSAPSNQTVSAPSSASFNVTASGSNNLYKWEMSEGFTWHEIPNSSPYSNINTATLNISSTTISMNGYQYRCVVSSSCSQVSVTSSPATLTVNSGCTAPYNGIISPSSPVVTAPNSITFSVMSEGSTPFIYQWYWWDGTNWIALTNTSPYSGTTTKTLNINPTSTSMDGYFYTCLVSNSCGDQYNIKHVQLKVNDNNSIVDIDGNIYTTVSIGKQVWLGQNLKTTKYNDGTSIPLVTGNSAWSTLTTPAYCWYNNDISYKNPYGALYNWYAVNTGKLCPEGWHVPTEVECTILTNYLGGDFIAGGKLKETGTTHWQSPNTGATDSTGFSGLPGGLRQGSDGTFLSLKSWGIWWGSTLNFYDNNSALGYSIYDDNAFVSFGGWWKDYGFSVRCICDLPVSSEIISTNKSIKVYPNPTSGIITIEGLPENEKAEIALYNINSKLVKVQTSYSSLNQMDISEAVSGVYLLVINNRFEQAVKIIKK
jgi:uncharacterized protein (TIGR02145 family)